MFVDSVKIQARAGKGGNGCLAFSHEPFKPKGGPCGGDGGRGGDVILQADHDINNLIAQFYAPHLYAKDGRPGEGKGKTGRGGKKLIVKVPCGTMVWKLPIPKPTADEQDVAVRRSLAQAEAIEINFEVETEEPPETSSEEPELIADLTEHAQQFVLCAGGRGGKGNMHFTTSTRQAPRFAQDGEVGEDGQYRLELRLLAEIGLVGYPNAGKSTLLSAISSAQPKIASYPFTTLHPNIGIVQFADYSRLTVCDIPGIIEGAHENVGLGHAFLRHILRCRVLVLLIDMAGTDEREPWEDYEHLLSELEQYNPELLSRPRLVAANKMDEKVAPEKLKEFQAKLGQVDVVEISAAFDLGLDELKKKMQQIVAATSED
ncbi:MAG TPA: GTPase ObgE [Verrucomicrobiota bacterium]|nr:GTPase ObgE [Verrucomicrobiota bacterium]